MSQHTPKRVAILGGGVGAMTTALQLTNDPSWRDTFSSITVYQMGWRLGGKGASGRGEYGRIEEHGLHVWMGFYENAFAAIRRVYEEAGRAPGTPLATWQDAFKQHDFIDLAERYQGSWRTWPLEMPRNNQLPGSGLPIPSLWDHIKRVLGLVATMISGASHAHSNRLEPHGLVQHVVDDLLDAGIMIKADMIDGGAALLSVLLQYIDKLDADPRNHQPKHHRVIVALIDRLQSWLHNHYAGELNNDDVRHAFVLIDFSFATIRGTIAEDLLAGSIDFDTLDQYDFVEWLTKHGASSVTCTSGLVTGMYDLMLAYEDGNAARPSFGAGTCLHFAIRMALTYRGSVFWKMQAGMGDTIFAPMYTVLKNRGVEFKFFHCVKALHLSTDKSTIESIDIGVQATTINDAEYQPFVRINDLDCWPSKPNYDQLVEGEALQSQGINLESFWTPWSDVKSLTLQCGRDFDTVVLGIPVGSHPFIASELADADAEWKLMTENVKTTRTLALQLWLTPTLKELGWTADSPIMDSYQQPFNTWADMSQLIIREDWPVPVGNVAYFCGPMEGGIPPHTDSDAPSRETEAVKQAAIEWLKTQPGWLWPKVCNTDGALDWSVLADPRNGTGTNRLNSQFWRANIDPSERYVLSVPGSTAFRLRADNVNFRNLIITGDWVWNPINAGCVEATVMSGMMAANIMLGKEIDDGIEGFHRS